MADVGLWPWRWWLVVGLALGLWPTLDVGLLVKLGIGKVTVQAPVDGLGEKQVEASKAALDCDVCQAVRLRHHRRYVPRNAGRVAGHLDPCRHEVWPHSFKAVAILLPRP